MKLNKKELLYVFNEDIDEILKLSLNIKGENIFNQYSKFELKFFIFLSIINKENLISYKDPNSNSIEFDKVLKNIRIIYNFIRHGCIYNEKKENTLKAINFLINNIEKEIKLGWNF